MTAMSMPWSWGGGRPDGQGPRNRGAGGWDAPAPEDDNGAPSRGRREARRAARRAWAAAGGPWGPWNAMGGPGHHHAGYHPPHPPQPPRPPHWGGGAPFGPGGPFGPFGGGPRHRRGGGPRARRGDVRTGILLLLAEEPRSGYEIIREGKERSNGAWRPSPGSVYPMLQQLEDEGLVRPAENAGSGRRRPFELTEEGHGYVEQNAADLTAPWESVAEEYEDSQARYAEIGALAYQLSAAAAQVAQAGTDDQLDQAKRLLAETKRGLYRILAEDERAEGADGPAGAGDGA
ncbi:PadR family transcriptional regulator [Nocardiopsis mangrovi]|uniref:PadR family transcriptional regulator n=1 Tax=Nocardiopsis mangrovi TaxID=1179818 RepID=A0ABV9DTU6_9ACTN